MNRLKALSLYSIIVVFILQEISIADSFRLGANVGPFQCLNEVINGSGRQWTLAFWNPGFGNGLDKEIWAEYHYKFLQFRFGYGDVGFKKLKTWTTLYGNGYDYYEYTLKLYHKLHYYPLKLTINYCPHSEKSKVYPFVGVGAGYYSIKWHEDELAGEDSLWIYSTDSKAHTIGFHAVLGAEYAITKIVYWQVECEFSYLKADMVLHDVGDYYNRDGTYKYENNNFGGIALRTGIVFNILGK
jgi:hypothetical protein